MLMLRWHEAVNLSERQPYEYGLVACGGVGTWIQMLYPHIWLSFKAIPAEELLHLPALQELSDMEIHIHSSSLQERLVPGLMHE